VLLELPVDCLAEQRKDLREGGAASKPLNSHCPSRSSYYSTEGGERGPKRVAERVCADVWIEEAASGNEDRVAVRIFTEREQHSLQDADDSSAQCPVPEG
jgi:hypothetical protein